MHLKPHLLTSAILMFSSFVISIGTRSSSGFVCAFGGLRSRGSHPRHSLLVRTTAGTISVRSIYTTSSTQRHVQSIGAKEEGEVEGQKPSSNKKVVPITLLSGFLGSGKTSALIHLLQNKHGYKIGVIVNDVASVNIDAKLISNPQTNSQSSFNNMLEAGETVELQNGCACCSLADELLTSVHTLLNNRNNADHHNNHFDAVVVELSGVADPVSVKQNWMDATVLQHPVTKLANIERIVTVIDASSFGTDYMSWNVAGDREGWTADQDECSAERKVSELLAEQIEAADAILVNKADLAGHEQVAVVTQVAKGLNNKDSTEIFPSEFGKIPYHIIIGSAAEKNVLPHDPNTCTDPTHNHSHDHSTTVVSAASLDPTHDHSHGHTTACADPICTDPTHDHSHHGHTTSSACADPTCTDPTHDHSHHEHTVGNNERSTSTKNLGIGSFVFKAAVPFHAGRLMNLLNKWPVPIKDTLDIELLQDAARDGYEIRGDRNPDDVISPFIGVLRSKGFCWLAPSSFRDDSWRHDTAMYWSHAGKHFGITTAGKWWGSLSKEKMSDYFQSNPRELDRILQQDFVSDEWGDRRQEIVFIGTSLKEDKITSALQSCLLNESELGLYRQQLKNLMDLSAGAISVGGGPSLFDVGGTGHLG